jgi:hypothetical protein
VKKWIYIGNVKFVPPSSREVPYQFGSFQDVREFARITGHCVFAVIPGDPSVYRFWPGGRIEEFQGSRPKEP